MVTPALWLKTPKADEEGSTFQPVWEITQSHYYDILFTKMNHYSPYLRLGKLDSTYLCKPSQSIWSNFQPPNL